MLDATRLRVLVAIARNGSVTAAAQALNYAQPSISHHIARLEAETGAKLMERAGRGIRLTDAGRLLAERAEEILGRLDAAEAELAAHVGLRQDRVRLAAFGSALGTVVPAAAARLQAERPELNLTLTEAAPAEALRMLRAGLADVALVFRYYQTNDDAELRRPDLGDARPGLGGAGPDSGPRTGVEPGTASPSDASRPDASPPDADPTDAELADFGLGSLIPDADGLRARLVLDEPVYLITGRKAEAAVSDTEAGRDTEAGADAEAGSDSQAGSDAEADSDGQAGPDAEADPDGPIRSADTRASRSGLARYARHRWIAGDGCRDFLFEQCAAAGFTPNIAFVTDDRVACQALVAAGLGVTILPGLALSAARHPGIAAKALPGARRQVLAVTYGEPPDPPASARLIDALVQSATTGQATPRQRSQRSG